MRKRLLAILLVTVLTANWFSISATALSVSKKRTHKKKIYRDTMILATTTSLQDSGLLDYLIPKFEKVSKIRVKTVAVGSGEALTMGEKGDADALFVHSPDKEKEFMNNGYGTERITFMHNYFAIVGPKNDPAGVGAITTAVDAFKAIAKTQSNFISRGDQSGTHLKELKLWDKAKISPQGNSWYIESGQGMGATLMLANQKYAYTLSDRSTFYAYKNKAKDLRILTSQSDDLVNRYSTITVSKKSSSKVKTKLAKKFTKWVTSKPVKAAIARYGIAKYGQPLFYVD